MCDVSNGVVEANGPPSYDMIPKTKETIFIVDDRLAGN